MIESDRKITAVEPESVLINVPVSGLPVPTITWSNCETGKVITEKDERVFIESGATFSNLTITPSQRKKDCGKYKLILENNAGKTDYFFHVKVLCKLYSCL